MKDVYTFVISSWCGRIGDVRCDFLQLTDNSGFPSQWSSDLFIAFFFACYILSERKFNLYGKPTTGNFIRNSISCAAAD